MTYPPPSPWSAPGVEETTELPAVRPAGEPVPPYTVGGMPAAVLGGGQPVEPIGAPYGAGEKLAAALHGTADALASSPSLTPVPGPPPRTSRHARPDDTEPDDLPPVRYPVAPKVWAGTYGALGATCVVALLTAVLTAADLIPGIMGGNPWAGVIVTLLTVGLPPIVQHIAGYQAPHQVRAVDRQVTR